MKKKKENLATAKKKTHPKVACHVGKGGSGGGGLSGPKLPMVKFNWGKETGLTLNARVNFFMNGPFLTKRLLGTSGSLGVCLAREGLTCT